MNKQELIKKYEGAFEKLHVFPVVAINEVLKDLRQLDEPQKVTIPQFVASWIKYCKGTGVDLYHALEMGDLYFCNYANQKDDLKLKDFFEVEGNQEIFARAWLDGYEVDKENRYRVKMKGMDKDFTMLKLDEIKGGWYLGSDTEFSYTKNTHTRKELEQAGFGEVFDSPLFEVEEVE
nr:MAG TPA: Protein of unknown function (DUF1642) [Caudoviricetes sp.]